MTSELKPCPFCLRPLKRSSGKFNPMAACETDGCWMKEKQIAVPCDDSFSVKSWNTRAVPDVPELVRWKHCEYPNQHKMMEHTDGEYVLHSQAAKIIAADRAEIERLSQQCHDLNEELQGVYDRAEALRAMLNASPLAPEGGAEL